MNATEIDNLQLAFPIHEILDIESGQGFTMTDLQETHTAVIFRVVIENDPDRTLFVKTSKRLENQEGGKSLGLREVQFYRFLDSFNPALFANLPRCHRAGVGEDGRSFFLVLEDLENDYLSYSDVDFKESPPWISALTALATFHRNMTGKLTASQVAAHADCLEELDGYFGKLRDSFQSFRNNNQEHVDRAVFDLLEKSLSVLYAIERENRKRIHTNQMTTILHRDAHMRNFLYPQTMRGSAKIVDWQFWGLGIGTYDLRHLLGSSLNSDTREKQRYLVRHYFEAYTEGLSQDYTWENCWNDYCKGVIDNLFMPVWQHAGFGWSFDEWGATLQAAVENYYALGCDKMQIE